MSSVQNPLHPFTRIDTVAGRAQLQKALDELFGMLASGRQTIDGNLSVENFLATGSLGGSNVVYVDPAGDNATAARGDARRPFRTIQAAINAAVAGDVVRVWPGTYNELIVCKNDVSVRGLDARRCSITRVSAASEVVVTMAERMTLADFSLSLSNAGGAVVTTGVRFGGTSNETSSIVRVVALGTGGNVQCVELTGTGLVPVGRTSVVACNLVSSGVTNGILHNGTGTSRIRDTQVFGLVGLGVTVGTCEVLWSRLDGFPTGLSISAGATCLVDKATTYQGLSNSGTLSLIHTGRQMPAQTVQATSTVAISNVSPTIVLTLPAVIARGNRVLVNATIEFKTTVTDKNVSVRLFRDGVEVSVTDRYDFYIPFSAATAVTGHFHWYDAPTVDSPVYTIRVLAGAAGVNADINRRATATTA